MPNTMSLATLVATLEANGWKPELRKSGTGYRAECPICKDGRRGLYVWEFEAEHRAAMKCVADTHHAESVWRYAQRTAA